MHPVLVRLGALGIRVSADGSQLRVAPRSAINDEVRQLVRIHKDELLTALEAETGCANWPTSSICPSTSCCAATATTPPTSSDCQPTTCGVSCAASPPSGTTTGT